MGEKDDYPGAPVKDTQHVETSSSTGAGKEDGELAKEWSHDAKWDEEAMPAPSKSHNPLARFTREQLLEDVERFAVDKQLEHILPDLRKGALIAQDPQLFESLDDLSEEDKVLIRREKTHRWSQPFMMYFMTSMLLLFYLTKSQTNSHSPLCWFGHCAGNGSDSCQRSARVSPFP